MPNISKAASIQAQIAALQAQLQEVLAQEGLVPAPEPPDAKSALARADVSTMQEAVEQRLKQGFSKIGDFGEQGLSKIGDIVAAARERMRQGEEARKAEEERMSAPDPMEGKYEASLAEQAKEQEAEDAVEAKRRTIKRDQKRKKRREKKARKAEEKRMSAPDPMEGKYEASLAEQAKEQEAEDAEAEMDPALEELFKDVHGGPFDPKSKTDLRKMGEIKRLLAEQGGQGDMTNNQFALKLYRRFDYV